MRTETLLISVALAAAVATPAASQRAEIGYPRGSLAYKAILGQAYGEAETRLTSEVRVPRDDPARLINLAHVLAKTGRSDQAARLYQRVMILEDMELILADGRVMSSREAAGRGLRSLAAPARAPQR